MYYYKILPAHLYANSYYIYASELILEQYTIVEIEFSKQNVLGLIIQEAQEMINAKIIKHIFPYKLRSQDLSFLEAFAKYYLIKLGSALDLFLPKAILKKGPLPMFFEKDGKCVILNELFQKGVQRKHILQYKQYVQPCIENKFIQLDSNQIECATNIHNLKKGTCLLEGVTGSGKTIVALEGIAQKNGKILIITPEVNLSNSWAAIIHKRFGKKALIYNHKMNDLYKASIFHWALSNEAGFIISARSGLFLPYKNLEAIIIDEEHSSSLKQERYPRYHARDMAVLKANIENIPCILMSATPSLETVYNIENGKYAHYQLKRMPKLGKASVEIIKQEKNHILAPKIINEIEKTLSEKKQVLLFLNRKGYAPYCVCSLCFNILKCNGCDLAKIYYQNNYVYCHKCGSSEILPAKCYVCSKITTWKFYGIGVEKLMQTINELFPLAKTIAITSDTAQIHEQIESINNEMVDIVIATQVLAQGHDFKYISLVIIVDAHMGLNSPDFRATEKMFQLWQQIRGRSNRHETPGKMLIQALDENNKFINIFKQENAYELLKQERLEGNWPPYSRCAFLILKSKNINALKEMFNNAVLKKFKEKYEVYGPYYVGKLHFVSEWRYLIKIPKNENISNIMNKLNEELPEIKGIKHEVEIDPYNFL